MILVIIVRTAKIEIADILVSSSSLFLPLESYFADVLGLNRIFEDVENVYPCTPLQEGMMAETLLDPRANVEQLLACSCSLLCLQARSVHLRLPLLLRGVDAAAWKRAWQKTVGRHEAHACPHCGDEVLPDSARHCGPRSLPLRRLPLRRVLAFGRPG